MTPADLAVVSRINAQAEARRERIEAARMDGVESLALDLAARFHVLRPNEIDADDFVAAQCRHLACSQVEAVQYDVAECLHWLRVQERDARAWDETAAELSRDIEAVRR